LSCFFSSSFSILVFEYRQRADIIYSQKFYKLKKESEKLLGAGGASNGTEAKTPTKNKANAATPGTSKSGGKRKKAADTNDDEASTPSKKSKAAGKAEVEEEDNEKVKLESTGDKVD
jgi:hypothetical protein